MVLYLQISSEFPSLISHLPHLLGNRICSNKSWDEATEKTYEHIMAIPMFTCGHKLGAPNPCDRTRVAVHIYFRIFTDVMYLHYLLYYCTQKTEDRDVSMTIWHTMTQTFGCAPGSLASWLHGRQDSTQV